MISVNFNPLISTVKVIKYVALNPKISSWRFLADILRSRGLIREHKCKGFYKLGRYPRGPRVTGPMALAHTAS